MKKILIVEDNFDYRKLIEGVLSKEGYDVVSLESPLKGLELLAKQRFDLVISDLHLPVLSGVSFTESVKNISPDTACIILTGHPDEQSEVSSIQNNIDLYIDKSKPIGVILNYVEVLLKKYETQESFEKILTSKTEDILLNLDEVKAYQHGKEIELTPKEFLILKLLLSQKNVVFSRDELIELAWEEPAKYVDERLVDTHVKNLRKKLNTTSLMTVRGFGYRWNEVEAS